jgi:hypothetical protein
VQALDQGWQTVYVSQSWPFITRLNCNLYTSLIIVQPHHTISANACASTASEGPCFRSLACFIHRERFPGHVASLEIVLMLTLKVIAGPLAVLKDITVIL